MTELAKLLPGPRYPPADPLSLFSPIQVASLDESEIEHDTEIAHSPIDLGLHLPGSRYESDPVSDASRRFQPGLPQVQFPARIDSRAKRPHDKTEVKLPAAVNPNIKKANPKIIHGRTKSSEKLPKLAK